MPDPELLDLYFKIGAIFVAPLVFGAAVDARESAGGFLCELIGRMKFLCIGIPIPTNYTYWPR